VSAVLRQPRWWALAVLVLVVVFATIQLGRWQFGRWEDRRLQAEAVRSAAELEPQPLAEVVSGYEGPQDIRFTSVLASGVYQADRTVLIRNRPLDGRNGYLVMVPLTTAEGTVAVNRGWIPAGTTAAAPENVPAPPSGTVEVSGRIQPDEPARIAPDLPAGQALSLSGAVVQADALPGAYLDLVSEDPQVEPAPSPPKPPGTGTGPHLVYAVQWWLFGAVAVVGFVLLTRRDVLAQTPDPGHDAVV
jgi:cytochrome oxidase assembly protein ShyY1